MSELEYQICPTCGQPALPELLQTALPVSASVEEIAHQAALNEINERNTGPHKIGYFVEQAIQAALAKFLAAQAKEQP